VVIIDTDVCIHILRGNRNVIEQRRKVSDQVAISFITAAELFYGAEKSANPTKNIILVEQFLLTVAVIESNRSIIRRFGGLKASLERDGLSLADSDLLIAATALEASKLLVTGNVKHFKRIEGLKLDNWLG
jgi:tRNA(fMet)-specific endonuclease VapC